MLLQRIELHNSGFTDIVNRRTDTRIKIKIVDRVCHIVIFGADSKKNYWQTFNPVFIYSRELKALVQLSMFMRFESIRHLLRNRLMNEFNKFDEICVCGFSMGAGTGLLIEKWARRSFGTTKTISHFYDSPIRSMVGYSGLVNVTAGDWASRWPFVKTFSNKKIHRSPFRWWQWKKKHFYLRDVARGDG